VPSKIANGDDQFFVTPMPNFGTLIRRPGRTYPDSTHARWCCFGIPDSGQIVGIAPVIAWCVRRRRLRP
jgi:hypothetical protein